MNAIGPVCALVMFVAGCATRDLPLCPRLLEDSEKSQYVNHFTLASATELGVSVSVLSPYVARYSGAAPNLREMEKRYPFLLCAFDPATQPADDQIFMRCVKHAPGWIEMLNSSTPQNLMLVETLFDATCSY